MRPLLPLSLLLLTALACSGMNDPEPAPVTPDHAEAAPAPAAPAPAAPPPAPPAAPEARPLYYERAITAADLEGRTLRELSLMRNTISARVGHRFVKPWLHEYFSAQPWYKPVDNPDYGRLTALDKQNQAAIADAEAAVPRETLLAKKADLRAKEAAGSLAPEDAIELRLVGAALGEWTGDSAVPAAQRNPLEDPAVLDRQLTRAQLEGMSPRDLRLLRNTIFARHGREFRSAVLTEYFSRMSWYNPDPSFTDARLTDIDKRNITLIQSMENALGGPMSDEEHMMAEGWFAGA